MPGKYSPLAHWPLHIQHEVVARNEIQSTIIHGNLELIRFYEEKVKKVIEK